MRDIKYIVLHCTATQPEATVQAIQNYWKNALKWKSPGYHYIIRTDGSYQQLAPETAITNGVAGYNSNSIHISYIGGIDRQGVPKDTRTEAQMQTQIELLKELKIKYPNAVVQGHRDFPGVNKACPSFDVKTWLAKVGL